MIAHALSLSRVALAVPFFFWMRAGEEPFASALLLTLAIVTDLADGPIARRSGTESPAGRLIDHGSDFLFVSAGLAALAWRGAIPWLLPVLVAAAFAQYVTDSLVVEQRGSLRPNPLGRWNGILYFVVPCLEVAARLIPGLAWLSQGALLLAWALCASTAASMGARVLALRATRRSR